RGILCLAYGFGGVACASRKSGYSQWKTVQAPWFWDKNQFVRQPYQPLGEGLPSNACNVLECMDKDRILAGTCAGLAFSNGISSWNFVRGRDYARKNNSLYGAAARKTAIPPQGDARLLSEDFVSALAGNGKEIFVGFRTQGVDVLDADTMKVRKWERTGRDPYFRFAGPGGRQRAGGDLWGRSGYGAGGRLILQPGCAGAGKGARLSRGGADGRVRKSVEKPGGSGTPRRQGEKYCFQGRGLVHQG
ncbi:MAG: hypothetical protein ACLSUW_09685, partial [Akkermansia sp.]